MPSERPRIRPIDAELQSALWHATGRAARDDRKRFLALQGLLWSGPVLVLGSLLARLPDPAWTEILHPVRYILDPLAEAWRHDQDLAVLGYVGLQMLLLAHLWGLFGGAIERLAAVELTRGRREAPRAALSFARRHWRGLVGARVAIWLGVAAPLAAAALLAAAGRLPAPVGGFALAFAVFAAAFLALGAVVVLSVDLVAGFLTGAVIACEDSDAFDAVGRTFTYAAAGLPRLTWHRLVFFGGVLLGSGWRLLRGIVAGLVAWLALKAGAGTEILDPALAILQEGGPPPDALRLGLEPYHWAVAVAIALVAGSLAILWFADFVSRVCCARVGVYLLTRHAIDRVPVTELRTAPRARAHVGSAEAGFVEIGRVEDA